MKNAVIAVHGISPHQRYEIQDAFASALCAALRDETAQDRSARLGAGAPKPAGTWTTGIVWPKVTADQPIDEAQVLALRVECRDDGGRNVPCEPTVDVFEGYWSPVDKEQTTAWRVLSWLLGATFTPLENVGIPATLSKTAYDLIFTGAALVVGLALIIVVANSAVRAYQAYVTHVSSNLWGLLIAAVGAYLLVQVVVRIWRLLKPGARLTWWNAAMIALMVVGGVALLGWPTRGTPMSWAAVITGPSGWLMGAAFALRLLLSFASSFLVDTVGDIQTYTTHDENARYYQFRRRIIQAVGAVVTQVLRATDADGKALYDNIFLVGHSLGATVLMDVIIAVHALVEEEGLPTEAWRRIRAFVTYGAALEKTRFFFDVRNPHLSDTLVRLRKDVYGHLFKADSAVLSGPPPHTDAPPDGIFWTNYWYFTDVVANAIVSYASARVPGEDLTTPSAQSEHPVCVNVRLRSPRTLWPHSRYLGDAAFWHTGQNLGVAAIVAHA